MRQTFAAMFFISLLQLGHCRYIEGILKTHEKWAFLTRFCFLSEEGQFEYQIEYNEDQGHLNLLLYYDTDDQWPAVYKSNKTCEEREAALNIGQNQLINLTTKHKYSEMSGCNYLSESVQSKTYTMVVPTLSTPMTTKEGIVKFLTAPVPMSTEEYELNITLETTEHTSAGTEDSLMVTDSSTTMSSDFPYSVDYYNDLTTPVVEYTSTADIPVPRAPKRKRSVSNPASNVRFIRKSQMISCHNARRFRSSRERWWFIAISNCKGTKGIDVKYRILMTNGLPGDYWHEHFSADEFYILPILMAFSIAYSFLMLAIVMCSVELKTRQLLHTSYKIFVFSVILQLLGILFVSSCYLKLAISGLLATKIKRFGLVLMGASETTFLLLLLLLAKGYTITRGRLPLPASIKLTIFMCLYVVTYISIFIYEAEVFDPGEVLYLYESPAGYGLILLRILAWGMFVYSTIFTLKHYSEKQNFYYPFNIFGTVWFIAGPAFVISANTYIDKWVRESVVCAVLLFISFGGHLMFLLLTMPSVANKNFPYHVRTTQIGIMELTGTAGTSTLEQFSHHVYEPSTNREQTVIIPLTKRTEEIFEGMYNQRSLQRNSFSVNGTNGEYQNNGVDRTLENVMKWSVVKEVPAIELPNFERPITRNTSANSRRTNSSTSPNLLSRNSSFNPKENYSTNVDDYVKDVPIELFTVSKMVVTTNSMRNKRTADQIE